MTVGMFKAQLLANIQHWEEVWEQIKGPKATAQMAHAGTLAIRGETHIPEEITAALAGEGEAISNLEEAMDAVAGVIAQLQQLHQRI